MTALIKKGDTVWTKEKIGAFQRVRACKVIEPVARGARVEFDGERQHQRFVLWSDMSPTQDGKFGRRAFEKLERAQAKETPAPVHDRTPDPQPKKAETETAPTGAQQEAKSMGVRIEIVSVTPTLAAEWLALSKINRRLRERVVIAYAEAMKRGEWYVTDTGIGFDDTGSLVDGHHRLSAVVRANVAVRMPVFRGLASEARGAMDCGVPRSLNDRLSMFRPNSDFDFKRTSSLRMCCYLLTGREVTLVTIDDYDRWMRLFRVGLDWALEAFPHSSRLFPSPVCGALAFAHKTNPDAVAAFGMRLRDGDGLSARCPELALRDLLASGRVGQRGGDRMVLARKTLQAVSAAMDGRDMVKIQDGTSALEQYRKAYDTRAANNMAEAWAVEEDGGGQ